MTIVVAVNDVQGTIAEFIGLNQIIVESLQIVTLEVLSFLGVITIGA
jgi:hypothetical protein